jgi:ABC-type Na+ efflux pump permease subunit
MRKSEFTGTRAVFRFTLAQFLKGKSTIVTMIVMVVAVMVSMLVASYSMRGAYEASEIHSVAFENSTDYAITASDIASVNPAFEGLSEGPGGATVAVSSENGTFIVAATGEYTADDLSALENAALSAFNAARAGGVASYTSRVASMDEYLSPAPQAEDNFTARFTVSYAYSILVLVLVMFSTSYIVRAVLEEKASKLVELLMVSVKPLALIAGKILASMCLVVIEMGLITASVFGASLVAKYALHTNAIVNMFSASGALSALSQLNAFAIVVVIVSILLGYFTFSIIAGISGASCSDMEDMNKANMAVVLTAMFGYLASTVFMSFDSEAVALVTSLVPFLSIFVAPARYLLGDISAAVLAGSWAIQLIIIALMTGFGRRVYATLIMHRGERIKFRQLFSIAKGGERA